jgi:hypothetical protein
MVRFIVSNNVQREEVILPAESTICEVFEAAKVSIGQGTVNLTGKVISATDFNKPINSLVGDKDEYVVASVAKADCA